MLSFILIFAAVMCFADLCRMHRMRVQSLATATAGPAASKSGAAAIKLRGLYYCGALVAIYFAGGWMVIG